MQPTGHSISKTSFLKFEQCHKAFFLYKNHPYLRDRSSAEKLITFKRGHDVGKIAQQLFPNGVDVTDHTNSSEQALQLTAKLLEEKCPVIYEATFMFQGVLVMVDILVLSQDSYTGYEVKSSLKVSENYMKDACLQYYVLKNTLPALDDLFLVTLNPDYVKASRLDVRKLFRKRSMKEKAESNLQYFDHQLKLAHGLLEQNKIPDIAVGMQCFRPYTCDYFGTCWKEHQTDDSLFNLPQVSREKQFEWRQAGLRTIADVDESLLTVTQRKIRSAYISGQPIIDKLRLQQKLATIPKKIAAMDMEIWSSAIPVLDGTHCFEQIPFLVCIYDGVEYKDCFVAYENDEDQRKAFAEGVIRVCKDFEGLVVFDRHLERSVLNALGELFPELRSDLEKVSKKMIDIADIFVGLIYYHPLFKNSFSLKSVSSVLLPHLTYNAIGSGLEAMNQFEYFRTCTSAIDRQVIQDDLLSYCHLDCKATYELVEFLNHLA